MSDYRKPDCRGEYFGRALFQIGLAIFVGTAAFTGFSYSSIGQAMNSPEAVEMYVSLTFLGARFMFVAAAGLAVLYWGYFMLRFQGDPSKAIKSWGDFKASLNEFGGGILMSFLGLGIMSISVYFLIVVSRDEDKLSKILHCDAVIGRVLQSDKYVPDAKCWDELRKQVRGWVPPATN